MKNIPLFESEYGLATLIFKEIPYKKTAYVLLRAVYDGQLQQLLSECRMCCTLAGAESCYVSGAADLSALPFHTEILEMVCAKQNLPTEFEPCQLVRVTPENGDCYREIYNTCFFDIPNAATCERADLQQLIHEDRACLACQRGEFVGLGEVSASELRSIAVLPQYRGMGYHLALTLCRQIEGPEVTLQVASTNLRAMRLYDRLGFQKRRVISVWHCL